MENLPHTRSLIWVSDYESVIHYGSYRPPFLLGKIRITQTFLELFNKTFFRANLKILRDKGSLTKILKATFEKHTNFPEILWKLIPGFSYIYKLQKIFCSGSLILLWIGTKSYVSLLRWFYFHLKPCYFS